MDRTEQQVKLQKVTDMLIELSKGNFEVRANLDDSDDIFNAVLSGLNMLAEEIKSNKNELHAQKTLLKNVLENICEVVYAVRLCGSDLNNIRCEFVSPRIHEFLGYTENEMYANTGYWFDAVHTEDLSKVTDAFHQLLSGNEVICEYRVQHRITGEYVWIEDRMAPGQNENDAVLVFCSARNVSARKAVLQNRDALIKELNDKYNELMQFNYIVSHNLRGPVASIMGAFNLITTSLDESEKNEAIEYIGQAVEKLDTLIRDLNVILSTKSKLNEKVETFSVAEVLADIEHLLDEQLKATHASIVVDITPKANSVHSIRGYIQSCLYNLISNSIKYHHPKNKPRINVKVWKEYQTTYFQVADNGIGIDMDKYDQRIFGLYQRFDTQTEGKGLGLHMTKIQIESLGGTVTVTSKPGKGSVFTLALPQ
jgi:PAS domain S-box-containing protein